jgi:solute carrier family 25 carnitine/acylcarnitine transporter 20/29
MNDYIIGNIIGISQTMIGYPFDTLKTNIQNRNSIRLFYKSPIKLYTGAKYPLIMAMIGNTFMFGNYSQLIEYTGNKPLAACLTGVIGAFMITPFDYFKIQRQTIATNQHTTLQGTKLSNISINNMYRGLGFTVLRESIAIPAYFLTFDYMHNEYHFPAFISGALAGINSWLFTYPIDTLKTRRQLFTDKSIHQLIKMGKFYNGLGITLVRAVIVNGINFELYSRLKKYSSSPSSPSS